MVAVLLSVYICDTGARQRSKEKNEIGAKENRRRHAVTSRESVAREYIDRLENALLRLSYAMDDFDFDKIHWRLFDIYECFLKLDTLSGAAKRCINDSSLSVLTASNARMIQTQAFIDSFIFIMEQKQAADSTESGDSPAAGIRPIVINGKNTSEVEKLKLNKTLSNALTIPEQDSFKTVILETEKARSPQNYVEYEITKLKEKTADIHRYFDAGEFSMSRTELEWQIDYLSGVKTEIINYIASSKDTSSDTTHSGE